MQVFKKLDVKVAEIRLIKTERKE